ncbi:ABC transporter permease [Caldanaerobius polysaccharolyticus]|uniref:ABC transporter permease n=1 Tax=Caldanaerobius polysaccharolyticus TaxID=44256 RepID=UPI00047DE1BB|nr:ABC transporter permease [Caldanaerobius polysaccharolyticus]
MKFKNVFAVRETSIIFIILAMAILMALFIPGFLTSSNIATTLVGLSMDGVIAIGMTIVLVLGGIDLSVGSVMALSNVVAGMLIVNGVNVWISVLVSVLVSVLAGVVIGVFVTKIQMNPFITTLGMMSIARGIAYVFTKGSPVSLGSISKMFDFIGRGSFLGIPNPVIILFILVIVFDYLMRKSAVFRQVYFVGSNEKAAYLSGINVNYTKMLVYTISATLSGIAGIVTLARFGVATPTVGTGAELRAIAGAVIGGASLTGGVGTIWGALLGILLVGLVNNALVLMNVSVYWQSLVTGIVLIAAVMIDIYVNKNQNKA